MKPVRVYRSATDGFFVIDFYVGEQKAYQLYYVSYEPSVLIQNLDDSSDWEIVPVTSDRGTQLLQQCNNILRSLNKPFHIYEGEADYFIDSNDRKIDFPRNGVKHHIVGYYIVD